MKNGLCLSLLCAALGSLNGVETLIEAKGAFFYPSSSIFREIYSEGPVFGAEASIKTWKQLYTWTSGSFFIQEGHSIGLNDRTRIAFYPIGLGVKYLFPVKYVDFYLGAGGLATYMHIHDHSQGIAQRTCRWGGGGIIKTGILLNSSASHFFIDLFTDYSFIYVPVSKQTDIITHTVNLSGWSIGAGFGYRFGCR